MASGNPDGNLEPVPNQPRQPRNLQGLLRFAMEATKAEDAPGNSQHGPMDDERRQFLIDAMASITIDLTEVLKHSIEVLTNTERMRSIQLGQELPAEVQTAFTVLLDVIDDMDVANDFYKMGGFAIFPICYGSENETVRMHASSMLAESCQNNPFCQGKALECGFLSVLLSLAEIERGDALAKCLYAISCSCREFEPACRELITRGGCETLAHLLRAPESTVRTKAAFFIRYLCHNYPEAKEQFIKHNIVGTIAEQIKSTHDQTTEHLLSVLVALIEGLDATLLRQFRDPSVGLKQILENHLKHPDLVDDTYYEEKEYCDILLSKAFQNCPEPEYVQEVADR
ncbi:unnamed protein product [Arctia plantaginis]|uniref:Nucleotide exchange factor Fes1 domain-containing protein n=1 Tax=Arctia plantaginis TaxID=874455 RepID=A0A8S0YMR7_ARCPL|nr:unnamed protein product [Arctia plantaginis]